MSRFILWLLGQREPRNQVEREAASLSKWADSMATVRDEARAIAEGERATFTDQRDAYGQPLMSDEVAG